MTRLRLETFPAIEQLGPEWDAAFEAGPSVQTSRDWFAASADAALPEGASPCYLALSDADGPAAILPMVAGPRRSWVSLTTPYTCLYQPLLRPSASERLVRDAGAAFGRHARRRPLMMLEAMDPAWPGMAAFRAGLGDAGLATRSFTHFINWRGEVAGGSWEGYLQGRPGALRETIRRKTRALERDASLRLELVRDPAGFGRALAAYERVYARSWKTPEPFSGFNQALFAKLAGRDCLRIGVMWAAEQPIAAQYWTVEGGTATVLKLAHDDAFRRVSPGTVLTAFVIRQLIERDGVRGVDFGRGDDAYKRDWAETQRFRVGLLAINPLAIGGMTTLARHDFGRVLRAVKLMMRSDGQ